MRSTLPARYVATHAILRRRLGLATGVAMGLSLAGCGGDSSPAPVFKPLSYSYLNPLRLNVGQIQIQDTVQPAQDPGELGPGAPVPPDQALKQMAQDRLVAAGNSGTAVFTIDQASIAGQPGGALNGTMAVHLDIVSNSGGHAGYAEAHVARQFVPGSGTDNDGLKAQLYGLTTQMMQDMNVEFEFQLRRTLGDWMLDASGAPVAATVEQQPLSTPGGPGGAIPVQAAPAPASVGAPVQLAPPATGMPVGAVPVPAPDAAPAVATPEVDPNLAPPAAQVLSPPPGVLQPPPGAVPVATPQVSGPIELAPSVSAPLPAPVVPAVAGPAAATPYHGHYPTPPGYAPASGSATPSGY